MRAIVRSFLPRCGQALFRGYPARASGRIRPQRRADALFMWRMVPPPYSSRAAAPCCAVHTTREETGAFLRMQGVRYVNAGGRAPAGYSPLYALHNLVLAKAAAPPCPDAVRLTLDRAPAPAEVTDFMMRGEDDPGAWDNFYSELCTKLARGAAEVWAVRREGRVVSTAGAYALSPDTAYLAAVET